ncbi:hypothetical protein GCM10010430_04750 [Kitasatospora cystarginea]|uniref:Uncharacterized protein n=1 Tax=Kitasatospora cystarginea TaxID=58350 RepID=A0ABP5Q7Y1_9ACTN
MGEQVGGRNWHEHAGAALADTAAVRRLTGRPPRAVWVHLLQGHVQPLAGMVDQDVDAAEVLRLATLQLSLPARSQVM